MSIRRHLRVGVWMVVGLMSWAILSQAQAVALTACDSELCRLIAGGSLPELRWPDFSDYASQADQYYQRDAYRLSWFDNGVPTEQAISMIALLRGAGAKGLDPEDYDSSLWPERLARLDAGQDRSESALARLDLALTISMMRYVADLHFGKFNPGLFHARLDKAHEQFDLPAMMRQLARGTDNASLLSSIDPPFRGYQETLKALEEYTALANTTIQQQLPATSKAVEPGDSYESAAQLAYLLRCLGDLPPDGQSAPDRYEGALVAAVKHFQLRHGLDPDGRIGSATLRELNTPLEHRVTQLKLALERWRWVPHAFGRPPIVVNIPEFRLRALDASYRTELEMKIVVGQAYRHETPVFAAELSYLTFRPYWRVPLSIQRKELIPAVKRDHSYMEKHAYEVVDHKGQLVPSDVIDDALLKDLRSGKLEIRQRPGDNNALGLLAFMFPNEYDVYMHDTPTTSLFAKSRRDFSHGCIRLEKPVELAVWALKNNPSWNKDRILDMMHGTETLKVPLDKPIPVLIVYATAVVTSEGQVHFLPDIYGQDAALEAEQAKGYPTSGKNPVKPTNGAAAPRPRE